MRKKCRECLEKYEEEELNRNGGLCDECQYEANNIYGSELE